MPNYDGTGPLGEGRPGKDLGTCGRTDININSEVRRGCRKGMRRGFGGLGHRGWMRGSEMAEGNAVYSYDKDTLQIEKNRLEKLLNWVNDRLAEIER